MKETKMAMDLGISKEEAKDKMEQYLDTYPAVRQFFDSAVQMARDTGFAFTYLGRRRRLVDIDSTSPMFRWRAERVASNVPIQGCLPASTRILTTEGMVPIGQAAQHGTVWTGTSWASYERLNRGLCELAEIELSNGQILTCDIRHEVLVLEDGKYQFKKWKDLQKEDQVCMSLAQPVEFGDAHQGQEDHFYWMGYAVGNTWTSKGPAHRNAATFTFGDRKGRYKKEEKVAELLLYAANVLCTSVQKPEVHENKVSVTIENEKVRTLWESLGYCWGSTAPDKLVPQSVWCTTLTNRKKFLVGLLDADGSVGVRSKDSPCLHMCQKKLLQQVQLLFRTVGVETILRTLHDGSFRLDLNGAQAAAYLDYGDGRSIPKMPGMRADENTVEAVVQAELSSASHKAIQNRVERTREITPYTAAALLTNNHAPLYAVRGVVRTKALGVEETTYTLSVNSALHRFDSEGVISKNSAADIVKRAMLLIDEAGLDKRFGYQMFHQVHDEIIGACPEENAEACGKVLKEIMEHPLPRELAVPLPVDGGIGNSWGEAK